MYARFTHVQGDPGKVDAGITSYREHVLPSVQSVDGFKGTLLLVDRSGGKAIGISVFDSEEGRAKADVALQEARERTIRAVGSADIPQVELYEVAVIEGF
jgi:hypothetical protein